QSMRSALNSWLRSLMLGLEGGLHLLDELVKLLLVGQRRCVAEIILAAGKERQRAKTKKPKESIRNPECLRFSFPPLPLPPLSAPGNLAQETAHDLATARLGQRVRDKHHVGCRNRPNLRPHLRTQLCQRLRRREEKERWKGVRERVVMVGM